MKRTILLAVTAIVALMAASCQKEEMGRILTATIEQYEHDNKAYIDNDNYACWENDDHVNINGNPYAIRITDGEGRANTATIVGSDNLTGNLMAFYPADMANISSDGTGGTVTLPQTQTYRENNGHQVIDNPMAAYCPDGSNELRFRNLAALLKVTIHANTEDLQVRAIQVKGGEDQMLWGTSQLTLDYQNKPLLGKISDGGASVRLYFETPAEISAGANKSFYIVVPAGADFFDFTIAVLTNQGDAYLKTNRIGQTLPRNHIGAITYTPANNDKFAAIFYSGSVAGFRQNAFGGAQVISNDDGILLFDRCFTSIGAEAFYGCGGLTSIILTNNLTSIGEKAFWYCGNLTSIILTNNLTSIGFAAFQGCGSLTSISLPGSVTSLGENAFLYCSGLTSVSLSENLDSIRNNTFYGCNSLTSISLPESVTSIGEYAFYGCSSLTSVSLSENLDSIRTSTFEDCSSLTSISLPDNTTSIGDRAFYGCSSLTSISLSNDLTTIGNFAFSGCSSLTSLSLPDNLTSIGESAFEHCSNLTSVSLPENLTTIGRQYVFFDCTSLTTVYANRWVENGDPAITPLSSNMFLRCPLSHIYVPAGAVEAYKTGWGEPYSGMIEARPSK